MWVLKRPSSYGIKVLVLVDTRKSDKGSGDYEQKSNEQIWSTNPGRFEIYGLNYQN